MRLSTGASTSSAVHPTHAVESSVDHRPGDSREKSSLKKIDGTCDIAATRPDPGMYSSFDLIFSSDVSSPVVSDKGDCSSLYST